MRAIVVFVFAVSAIVVTSPDARAQAVSVAVKGGLNFAKVESAEAPDEIDANTGGAVGISVPITLMPGLRLQPELFFATQRFSIVSQSPEIRVAANGILMPVLLSLGVLRRDRISVWAFGGPYVARINDVTQTVGTFEADASDQVRDLDAGITFGAALELAMPRGAFSLELRGNRGLRDIYDAPEEIKTRSVMLLAGYRF